MKYFFIIALIMCANIGKSQSGLDTTYYKQQVKKASDSMYHYYYASDWDNFYRYTHPNIVKLIGGKVKYKKLIAQLMEQMKGATIEFVETDTVIQVLQRGKQFQCIARTNMQMVMEGKTIAGINFDYGVSNDGGKTWAFMNLSDKKNRREFKLYAPEMDDKLKIPNALVRIGVTLVELKKSYNYTYSKKHNSTNND